MTHPKAKIFIVDDHPLVREWLANLAKKNSDLTKFMSSDPGHVGLPIAQLSGQEFEISS